MDRLAYVIIFTGDLKGMRRFYEDRLGLLAREEAPDRVEFDTAGATLTLQAMPDPASRGVQLRFATDDIKERAARLAGRGAKLDPPGIDRRPGGKLASMRDVEGNRLTLWEPSQRQTPGTGPGLSAAIDCRDIEAQRRYFRGTFGFPATIESSGSVRFDAGGVALRLLPRARPAAARTGSRQGRSITLVLTVPEMDAWHEDRTARGVAFAASPVDRGSGFSAGSSDPDGNPIAIREAREPESLEERLAEPFEDDATPRRSAIRKPVRKGVRATSRVALRPRYRPSKQAKQRRKSVV